MENCEATRQALNNRIEEVDAEIARLLSQVAALEAEKIGLKSRQNALAPIARLPPELLVKIFSSYVTLLDHSDLMHFGQLNTFVPQSFSQHDSSREQAYQKLLRPDIFTLCHVSRGWRHTGLGCQSLWNSIQIQMCTSTDLLWFMWLNSGDLPIKLDFAGTLMDRQSSGSCVGPTGELVLELLRDRIDRFQSIGIYCDASHFLEVLCGRAEKLESLVVAKDHVDGHAMPRRVYDQVLSGGTPNLRHIDLISITIPWSSGLLSSPHLTHVALDYTPLPTPDSIARLITVLRPLRRTLETVKLVVDIPTVEEDMEFYLSRVTDRTTIELPNLKVLHLDWGHYGPLMAILSLLRMPKDMLSLRLNCGSTSGKLAQAIFDFSSCGLSPTDYATPEEVEIRQRSARCWREQRFRWLDSSDDHSAQTLVMERKPVWIQVAVACEHVANSTGFRLPWSFSSLRSFSIFLTDVPDHFWAIIAASRTLEIIQVDAPGGSHSFLQALSKGHSHTNDMHIGSVKGVANKLSLDSLAGAQADTIPFPALKAISFEERSRHPPLGWPGPGDPVTTGISMTLIKQIAATLERRSRTVTLEEVRFTSQGLPAEGLERLLTTTRCVIWEQEGGKVVGLARDRRDSDAGHT